MLMTLILGIAAGAGAPYAEEQIKSVLEGGLLSDATLKPIELRMFSFALLLVAASILAWLIGNGSGFGLALGALIGVAGPHVIERVQRRRAPDYGEDET